MLNAGFELWAQGTVQKLVTGFDVNGSPIFSYPTTYMPQAYVTWAPWLPVHRGNIVIDEVPFYQFANNTSFATGTGLILYNALQFDHVPPVMDTITNMSIYQPVVGAQAEFSNAIYTSYAFNICYENLVVVGNVKNPVAMTAVPNNAETETTDFDNCTVEGFTVGVQVAPSDNTTIDGGTYSNVTNILIHQSTSPTRVITISNPTFLPLSAQALGGQTQLNIDMQPLSAFDIAGYFVPGRVLYNGQELYFDQQAASYVDFPAPRGNVPAAFVGLTNAQLYANYGLAWGGQITPAGGVIDPPGIVGTLAAPAAAPVYINLDSQTYPAIETGYLLGWNYIDPVTGKDVSGGDTTALTLSMGWNVFTRTIMIDGVATTHSFLVYGI